MIDRRPDDVVKAVVVDTCAIWNLLSSPKLYMMCAALGFHFAVATYCIYECLHKPRKKSTAGDAELRERLARARGRAQFGDYPLSVEDLQEVDLLQRRKRLGKGELATIALAKRLNLGAQTDDDRGEKLAIAVLSLARVQTTPHVLGWLFFHGHLQDHELKVVVDEHEAVGRNMSARFRSAYHQALHARLLASTTPT